LQGEYHWHKHDNDDEFFFVLEGHFLIDMEDRTIDLRAAGGICRAQRRGSPHACAERAVILMAETSAIIPTGDR